jgi:beta-glucanase (GH16 family)
VSKNRRGVVASVVAGMLLLTACGGTPSTVPVDVSPRTAGTAAAEPAPSSSVASSEGLVWSAEFDGSAGEPLPASEWSMSDRGDGYGNNELQVYTPRADNVFQDGDGVLRLIARQEAFTDPRGFSGDYTSGRIETVKRFQYGRVEARMKVPPGPGVWSAFWLYGASLNGESWPDVGEIDIAEIAGNTLDMHSTIIGATEGGERWAKNDHVYTGEPWSAEWHVYAVEWETDFVVFSIDGTETFRYTPDDLNDGELWPFDRPYSITLNLALGGWGGEPTDDTAWPAEMLIDYVRVYDSTVSGR